MCGTVEQFPFVDPKARALGSILAASAAGPIQSLLVVGCGKGLEAAVLSDLLKAQVTGIDIDPGFDERACRFANLMLGDATRMEFADESFDAVYSFHALEHIPDYRQALREIHRVLRQGAVWIVGTPNRDRLIGYVGSKNATFGEIVHWNMEDWKARLKGKFRNEYGAHAGFSSGELAHELSLVFEEVSEVSLEYYRDIYAEKKSIINALDFLHIGRWLFPAVYFIGRR